MPAFPKKEDKNFPYTCRSTHEGRQAARDQCFMEAIQVTNSDRANACYAGLDDVAGTH
jgi:hypothetical protein